MPRYNKQIKQPADVLAPFIQEHPETAQMFQPLFDAMNQTGPGAAQAVQQVLTNMSGMPGPVGEIAKSMLGNFQTEFGGQLPGVTKAGVEGAIQEMSGLSTAVGMEIKSAIDALNVSMTVEMEKLIKAINTMINQDIKQDPANVPLITADVNPANTQIQSIGKSVTDLKTFLAEPAQLITLHSSNVNPLDGQVQLVGDAITGVKEFLASEGNQISLIASNINPLAGQITLVAGAPALVNQVLTQSTITMVGANTNPLEPQVQLIGQAITQVQQFLQQNTITMVGANTNPLEGQINSISTSLSQTQSYLNQNPIYIRVDTSGAELAIDQLQRKINALNSSMAAGGYGQPTAGGSYLGAYGPPNASYYQNPGASYPSIFGAKGFGPEVVNRPTRMLVGEAGPEMVSVIPIKGKAKWRELQSKTAARRYGLVWSFWWRVRLRCYSPQAIHTVKPQRCYKNNKV